MSVSVNQNKKNLWASSTSPSMSLPSPSTAELLRRPPAPMRAGPLSRLPVAVRGGGDEIWDRRGRGRRRLELGRRVDKGAVR